MWQHALSLSKLWEHRRAASASCGRSVDVLVLQHSCMWASLFGLQHTSAARQLRVYGEECQHLESSTPQVRPSLVLLEVRPPGAGGIVARLATAPAAAQLCGLSMVSCSLGV